MKCRKCGNTWLGAPTYASDRAGERLVYVCRCGYQWTTPCEDAPKSRRYRSVFDLYDEEPPGHGGAR